MTDDQPIPEAPRCTGPRRLGLSGKLLLLTIPLVMFALLMIYVPSIANFWTNRLNDRLAAANTAALVLDAAPLGMVPDSRGNGAKHRASILDAAGAPGREGATGGGDCGVELRAGRVRRQSEGQAGGGIDDLEEALTGHGDTADQHAARDFQGRQHPALPFRWTAQSI